MSQKEKESERKGKEVRVDSNHEGNVSRQATSVLGLGHCCFSCFSCFYSFLAAAWAAGLDMIKLSRSMRVTIE